MNWSGGRVAVNRGEKLALTVSGSFFPARSSLLPKCLSNSGRATANRRGLVESKCLSRKLFSPSKIRHRHNDEQHCHAQGSQDVKDGGLFPIDQRYRDGGKGHNPEVSDRASTAARVSCNRSSTHCCSLLLRTNYSS